MNNKKLIRLTEADQYIKEAVNNVLNEIGDTERGLFYLL